MAGLGGRPLSQRSDVGTGHSSWFVNGDMASPSGTGPRLSAPLDAPWSLSTAEAGLSRRPSLPGCQTVPASSPGVELTPTASSAAPPSKRSTADVLSSTLKQAHNGILKKVGSFSKHVPPQGLSKSRAVDDIEEDSSPLLSTGPRSDAAPAAGASSTAAAASKAAEGDMGSMHDAMVLDFEMPEKPQRRSWYGLRVPRLRWPHLLALFITLMLTIAGILLWVYHPTQRVLYLETWRWALFFAGFAPIFYLSQLLVHGLILGVEAKLFTTRQAMYYAVSIQKHAIGFLRALMLIPLFWVAFADGVPRPEEVQAAWAATLKLLICVCVFCAVQVLKVLLAKVMSSNFHKRAHFDKIQDALNKEYYLHALSQPSEHGLDLSARDMDSQSPHHPAGALETMFGMSRGPFSAHNLNAIGRRMSQAMTEAMAGMSRMRITRPSEQGTSSSQRYKRLPRAGSAPNLAANLDLDLSPPDSSPASVASVSAFAGGALGSSGGPPGGMGGPLGGVGGSSRGAADAAAFMGGAATMHGTHASTAESGMGASMRRPPMVPAARGADDGRRKLLIDEAKLLVSELLAQQPRAELPTGARGLPNGDAFWLAHYHALERHVRKNKLKATLTDQLGRPQDQADEVTSKREARTLAHFIFWNVIPDYRGRHIALADLEDFLGKEHAAAALKVLDCDNDGQVSLADMREAVLQIYMQRKNLALTLQDAHTVVSKLELIFGSVLHVLAFFVYLVIFQVDVNKVYVTLSSVILAFAFVFGNNIRNLYESVIFLFVVHPYDVGDVLLIDGVWHQVEEIALTVTLLSRWDGVKLWFPNAKLSTDAVANVSRSGNRWEGFKVMVDISTPKEVFDDVDKAVGELFATKPTEFSGNRLVVANFAGDPLKYTLCVWWEYGHTGQELRRMSEARHLLYMCVTAALVRLGARYTLPPYDDMAQAAYAANRPRGEGAPFMPPFMHRPALAVKL